MKFSRTAVAVLVGLLAQSAYGQCNPGDFSVTIASGSGSINGLSITSAGGGDWDISFEAEVSGGGTLVVVVEKDCSTAGEIGDLRITTGGSGLVSVVARPAGGVDLAHIKNICKDNVGGPDLEVSVEDVGEIGTLGITADRIDRVQIVKDAGRGYTGDVNGQIKTTGSAAIEEITIGGDLMDDVIAAGDINALDVAGDIGSSSTTITIECDSYLELSADNAWVDVDMLDGSIRHLARLDISEPHVSLREA